MVSKREVVVQGERSSESCLHCEINDLVEEHIEGQESVDIADLSARMAEAWSILFSVRPRSSKHNCWRSVSRTSDTHFSKRAGRSKGIRARCSDARA
jgi:hypothetical protein